jgi:hypothetical protein
MADRASSTWIVVVRSFNTTLRKTSEKEIETYLAGTGRFDPTMRDSRVLHLGPLAGP